LTALPDGRDDAGRADAATARLRIDLGYDGTDFAGFARQPGLRTVQAEVERALAVVLRLPEPPPVTAAGRTDAGVHARGQVLHVDVPIDALRVVGAAETGAADAAAQLAARLNGVLPDDIAVHAVGLAPPGFDARFSALARRYSYRVADRRWDPLRRRDTLRWPRPLDETAMNAAGAALLGEHDFAAFCRRRENATTIRRLLRFEWLRDGDGVLVAQVEADAFCHSMVRALVGAALAVGAGRRPVGWPAEVLATRVRDPAVTVVPPHGLTLEEVCYPPVDLLAARAAQTRRRRDVASG